MTPRQTFPRYDAPDAVMRLAGAWLARRDRGLTASETEEFEAWRGADPAHAAAVAQLERTMTAFDALRVLAPESAGRPDPDALAPRRANRRWFLPACAAAGMAAALALIFWTGRPAAPTPVSYATAPEHYERATLTDGSIIELNGDSRVEVEYSAAQRTVRLTRGEAHFQVAKNPARPFVVIANGVAFRAVGTAFRVRIDAAQVEMLVTEGKVQVEPPAAAEGSGPASAKEDMPLLTAGHRIVVSAGRRVPPAISVVTPDEMTAALAWQPQVAEFEKTPLGEVVAAFNRRNRLQLVIGDAELEGLRIGGNFRLDQPDAFVRLLEASFGVKAMRTEEVVTLRRAP